MAGVKGTDIFIAAAAVADYRCNRVAEGKIKKHAGKLSLELARNPDILMQVAGLSPPPFTVGFAAETEGLEANARAKLESKGLDMIAANRVGPGLGFDSDDNALDVYWRDGEFSLETMGKEKLARRLIRLVAERYHAKHTNQTH